MTTVYDADDDGNIIVVFDSRWRFPELLGYSPDDPEYKALQRMWEKATGKKIPQALKKLEQKVLEADAPRGEVKDAETGQG